MALGISPAFARLFPSRGQVTHALLTRSPLYRPVLLRSFSCDLHVLGAPPALVLSQDQTLRKFRSTALRIDAEPALPQYILFSCQRPRILKEGTWRVNRFILYV